MGAVKQFEELHVWQNGQALAKAVFELCGTKALARQYVLADQLKRAALSIPTNIAEGFERGSRTELIQYGYISKGSAGELRSLLAFAYVSALLTKSEYDRFREQCLILSRQLTRFVEHLKKTKDEIKGPKFTLNKKA